VDDAVRLRPVSRELMADEFDVKAAARSTGSIRALGCEPRLYITMSRPKHGQDALQSSRDFYSHK
jgi:hypothetical protein